MNKHRFPHSNNCLNKCIHTFGSPWVCFHPNAIGKDGDGVGLTELEREHVKRLGCASYESSISDELNFEMHCSKYHKLSVVLPDHCYNCAMRNGYPQSLWGDTNCENFKDVKNDRNRSIR